MGTKGQYIGRFAPSPTGALHLGSMVAAVGSFLQARSNRGVWRVRIEDIDPAREVPGAARNQLATLAAFGMQPDEPVIWQSRSRARHESAIRYLVDQGLAFHCGCTRRDMPRHGVYPGTCRDGLPPDREPRAIRIRAGQGALRFRDGIQGWYTQDMARQIGDFVIRRADDCIAYQLAVAVDDAEQGFTEVVRGADLLASTTRQIHVQKCLGLPTPDYLHLPLVLDTDGRKLSKSRTADPVRTRSPATTLGLVLDILGHRPPDSLRELDPLWRWAIENWDIRRVPVGPIPTTGLAGVHADQA